MAPWLQMSRSGRHFTLLFSSENEVLQAMVESETVKREWEYVFRSARANKSSGEGALQ